MTEYPRGDTVPFPRKPYPQQVALMDTLLNAIAEPSLKTTCNNKSSSFQTNNTSNNTVARSSSNTTSPSSVIANLNDDDDNDQKNDNNNEPITNNIIETTKILLLESPTGTGKSLSLACASLAWLEYQKQQQQQQQKYSNKDGTASKAAEATILQTPEPKKADSSAATTTTTKTGLDWIDAWQPADENDDNEQQQRRRRLCQMEQTETDRLDQLQQEIHKIRQEQQQSFGGQDTTTTTSSKNRRLQTLKQAITKTKIQARKKQRLQRRRKKQPLEWEDDDDDDDQLNDSHYYFQYKNPTGSIPWMLEPPVSSIITENNNGTTNNTTTNKTATRKNNTASSSSSTTMMMNNDIRPKIIYAARTHSQLSQFVSEVRKTHWGHSTKVIALASRSQGMCGYLTTTTTTTGTNTTITKTEADLVETCLELRQSKKRANNVSTCACPFYHKDAIATLALHSLAHPTDVEDWKEMGQATQTCAYYASRQALHHADLVVLPYSLLVCKETRESIGLQLDNATLVLVDEAHNLPQAIANLQSCTLTCSILKGATYQVNTYTKEYMDRLSPRHLQLLGHLKLLLRGFQKSLGITITTSNGGGGGGGGEEDHQSNRDSKELLSPLQFLCRYKLDRINLFPLLRYMEETKLSQKLLGFVPTVEEEEEHHDDNDCGADQASEKSTTKKKKKKKKTTRLSPMAVVESFLSKLNYANDDGKIVICPQTQKIQFVVLNPAVASEDDLYHKPHALCLVGGTLQPMDVMMQELVPKLAPLARDAQRAISNGKSSTYLLFQQKDNNKLVAFSCGHVVPKSNVLLQAVTKVVDNNNDNGVTTTTTLDIRHKSRSMPQVMTALGKSILRLAKKVPNGMVVFTGSYRYEQALVDYWKTQAPHIWRELNSTKRIFREPKDSKQTDEVLTSFAKSASTDRRGALLFSVMGGKLSEGINFANELCRCVVVIGLPYPDAKDPLLQEKLKLLPGGGGGGGFSYLRSLCLRSVNQSVGRAIRHANDFAGIVLMDVRYTQDDAIGRGLPKWLTESTPDWKRQDTTLSAAERRLEEFFQLHDD